MNNNNIIDEYEEYLVTDGNGNLSGYFKTYNEAISNANKHKQSQIYGAYWTSSKSKGLLHRDWKKIS